MRMYDLIEKKKRGFSLTKEEISYMIQGYMNGKIPDYQVSAMLMAIYFNGMDDRELTDMTRIMAHSGHMADLSAIEGKKVDKHSTGGVGDKTTLVIGPMAAACGVKVAKMSGRGLGFTGGTIDKLESITGFRTGLLEEEFSKIVNEIGISVIGQTKDLAPADKMLYALRDVTATVDSIPLIAASVMSKKLAAGSDCILLDVTCGSGAFMKNKEDAASLARKMVAIGQGAGKQTIALITNMDTPLGTAIGNSLEVEEAVGVLKGKGPEDLKTVCLHLGANMLYLAGKGTLEECRRQAEASLENGSAFEKFVSMVERQEGDSRCIRDTEQLKKADYSYHMVADKGGYIKSMDTELCGVASGLLGAGRERTDSPIDYTAGIKFLKKTGDFVEPGETMAVLYSSSYHGFDEAEAALRKAYQIGMRKPEPLKLVLARVTIDGVEWF